MKDKRFLMWYSMGIVGFCCAYFVAVTFVPVPTSGQRYADMILGALIGSGFTALLAYYWGSSQGSRDKDEPKQQT